jgi:hypothetical protein
MPIRQALDLEGLSAMRLRTSVSLADAAFKVRNEDGAET